MEPDIVSMCIDVILQQQIVASTPSFPEDTVQISTLEVGAKSNGRTGLRGFGAVVESDELVVSDAVGYVSYKD